MEHPFIEALESVIAMTDRFWPGDDPSMELIGELGLRSIDELEIPSGSEKDVVVVAQALNRLKEIASERDTETMTFSVIMFALLVGWQARRLDETVA